MLGLFIDAAVIMDDLFWQQAYGDRDALLRSLAGDPRQQRFAELNYGPWDRLDGNAPFVAGVGPKPPGAQFYPLDMTKEEFERADLPGSRSEYTRGAPRRRRRAAGRAVPRGVRRRGRESGGAARPGRGARRRRRPQALPRAARRGAAHRRLPRQRPRLARHEVQPDRRRDRADRDLRGPAVRLQGRLRGVRAGQGHGVEQAPRRATPRCCPSCSAACRCPDAYKAEQPGTDSDLNAYDVVYYAGDCNAGSKTIAINLPNDEQVQLEKGTRRLQLKNAMRAKFDAILVPIADELIVAGPAPARHVRRVLRRHDVPRSRARARHQEHDRRQGHGARRAEGTRQRARGRQGRHPRAVHDHAGCTRRARSPASLEDYYVTFLTGHLPLGALRRGVGARPGEHAAVQFLRRPRRVHARRRRALPRGHAERCAARWTSCPALILKLQGDGDYAGVSRS